MASCSLLLLLLLLLVPLLHFVASRPPIVFDHYLLALTWPNAYCKLEQCLNPSEKDLPQIFTTHGLWPAFVNRTSVPKSSCIASAFNVANLNSTVLALANQYWPDIYMSKERKPRPGFNTGFWKHEWDSHGICSNLGEGDYMYVALTVYKNLELALTKLVKDHRTTGKNTVDIVDFQNKLTNLLGGGNTPIMVCGNVVKKSSTKQYLREIRIRVEKSFPYSLISDNAIINCDTSKPVFFEVFP